MKLISYQAFSLIREVAKMAKGIILSCTRPDSPLLTGRVSVGTAHRSWQLVSSRNQVEASNTPESSKQQDEMPKEEHENGRQ